MSWYDALAIVATIVVVAVVVGDMPWRSRAKPPQEAQDGADAPAAPNPQPVALEPAYASPSPVQMDFWEIKGWAEHEGFTFRKWDDLVPLNAQRTAMGYPPIVRKVQ